MKISWNSRKKALKYKSLKYNFFGDNKQCVEELGRGSGLKAV